MPRVKRGSKRREKRKKLLSRAKGYFLGKSKLYKFAKESVDRAGNFAYINRKRKKRDFRHLWIIRINAAARSHDITYSQLIAGLRAPASASTASRSPRSQPPTTRPLDGSWSRRRRGGRLR
jgi:large subunit ribosomal protein L20